jgi:hypothetical protein
MANTGESTQAGAPDPPAGERRTAASTDRGRRWYHPRPQPRCRADVMGFNYTCWLFCILLVVLFLAPW